MKKLVLAVAMIATIASCSKESDLTMNATNNRVELSSDGSFDVGTIDGAGNGILTYDLTELQEICACAVSEDMVGAVQIDHVPGVGYYLSGIGSSTGSNTTFSIELTVTENVLSWADNALIMTCETTSSVPCELDVVSELDYSCSNTAGSCGQTVIGGENGASYNDCNWPWLIPSKTKS